MNRLSQHLAAISSTIPPAPPELRNGELVFGILLWRRRRGAKWRPQNPTATPPITEGRYALICSIERELPPVLREVLEFNTTTLEAAAKSGKKIRSWAVPVKCVYGFDETATLVEIGGGL